MSKRELDKESMFRKIMPSAQPVAENTPEGIETAPPTQTPAAPSIEAQQPLAQAAPPQEHPASPSPAETAPVPPSPQAPEAALADAVAVFEQPAYAQEPQAPQQSVSPQVPAAAVPETAAPQTFVAPVEAVPSPPSAITPESLAFIEEVQPVNLAEKLVEMYYPRYLQRLEGCPCQRCQDDVFGIALNKITPRYIPANQVSLEDLQDKELIRETVTHLIKAIFIVKKNPHHDALTSIRK